MNVAAGPELAAAVTNAGGLGVIGGVGYTPKILRQQVSTSKFFLSSPARPFPTSHVTECTCEALFPGVFIAGRWFVVRGPKP
jgi:NAD(P)H-dependent flavin oxidoreductase YrpB (nitropropane dioxygenase family)